LQSEPIWLPVDEVIETNRISVSLTGEPFHVLGHGRSALMFLNANGYDLSMPDGIETAELVIRLVERKIDARFFAEIVRPYLVVI
jgi:hypothetical protein